MSAFIGCLPFAFSGYFIGRAIGRMMTTGKTDWNSLIIANMFTAAGWVMVWMTP